MAVLPQIPGLSVVVKVEGQAATEHAPPEDDQIRDSAGVPTSKCFIQSRSNAQFSVEAAIGSQFPIVAPSDAVLFHLRVDGTHVRGTWMPFKDIASSPGPYVVNISHTWAATNTPGQYVEQYFTFSPVTTLEDAANARILKDAQRADSLGLISLQVSVGRLSAHQVPYTCRVGNNNELQLAEKAMKGREISHGTTFSSGSVVRGVMSQRFGSERVIGEFLFFYRSQSALEKELILRPPVSSSPALDDIDNMTEEELRQFARGALRSKQQMKREREGTNDGASRARQFKAIKLEDGKEVVDLTED